MSAHILSWKDLHVYLSVLSESRMCVNRSEQLGPSLTEIHYSFRLLVAPRVMMGFVIDLMIWKFEQSFSFPVTAPYSTHKLSLVVYCEYVCGTHECMHTPHTSAFETGVYWCASRHRVLRLSPVSVPRSSSTLVTSRTCYRLPLRNYRVCIMFTHILLQ